MLTRSTFMIASLIGMLGMSVSLSGAPLPVVSAGYLGGGGDDGAGGVLIAPDHRVIVGGTFAEASWPVKVSELAEGGKGMVVCLDPAGQRIVSAARVGEEVLDVASDANGQIVLAAGASGVVVLDPAGGAVAWRDGEAGTVKRIAASEDGMVVALTADKHVRLYDAKGKLVATRRFRDSYLNDVTIHGKHKLVIVTGFNNKRTGREPAQVAFIRAFHIDRLNEKPVWVNYDWPGRVLRQEQDPNVADSRGYRVNIGEDGKLYYLGESHGGNSTYSFDPQEKARRLKSGDGADAELVRIDAYSVPFNTRADALSVFGRYDAKTGKLEHLQWMLARREKMRASTLRARGIAADAKGRAFITGLTTAPIARRDENTIAGEAVGPFAGGEAFFAVIAPDFTRREHWTPFTAPTPEDGRHASIGMDVVVRGEHWAVLAHVTRPEARMVTTDKAAMGKRPGGEDVYLVVGGKWPSQEKK